MKNSFYTQILEMIDANGWSGQFKVVECSESTVKSPVRIQIYLSEHHPVAPSELINLYEEGVNPLEQIQQECLRALRTGRSGV